MDTQDPQNSIKKFVSVFQYSGVALEIVWSTSAKLTVIMALTTVVAGVLPAAIASVGGLFVDVVSNAFQDNGSNAEQIRRDALYYVFLEAGLVVLMTGAQRVNTVCQSILRVLLGNKINVMILEKALTLELAHFEDAEYYDKLVRARREASSRPLSLVIKTFDLFRDIIALITIGIWLFQFSPYAVLLLGLAGVPAFLAEAKFSGEAFRIHRRRSAERRMQIYLEMVLTREDGVKEVKLLQLGKMFLQRYIDIFLNIYKEDRSLVLRRGFWGYVLGLVASAAFYFAYGWVGFAAIAGAITIGQMTMYIAQFRLGQTAVTNSLTSINGMYEDNLYLSNLTEYLDHKVPESTGEKTKGPNPEDGIRFENVSFYYPGSEEPALHKVNLHITPGESLAIVGENGSGKTTLIKLLTRLYAPTEGRIVVDGLDLQDWDTDAVREKIGVIFQDFARYQLIVGENIGIGDVDNIGDDDEISQAARKGMAEEFVKDLPQKYQTQLGTWFKDGKELSGGQWQKIALSRAFMRSKADILILDEPTAAIDARAEAEIFAHFGDLTENRISIIISHRFSTVRMADHIIVLEKAEIMEQGSHQQLLDQDGQYATLFNLTSEGLSIMMDSPFLYLFVGFLACFIGTIPFGPINLAVVKTTVDYDRRSGIEIALAASLVEMLQSLIAIFFGMLISSFLDSNVIIKFFFAFVFIGLAIYIFTRKPKPTLEQKSNRPASFFRNGLIIAGLNPQAVPFWIFALATISQYFQFQYVGVYLAGFVVGVFAGKLLALYGFVVASTYLKSHLQESSTLVNRLLAAILLFIGLSQGWNAINSVLA